MNKELNPVLYAQWVSKYIEQVTDTTYDLRSIIQQGFFTDNHSKTPFIPKADEVVIINEFFGKKMKPYGNKAKNKDIAYYHTLYYSALDSRVRELVFDSGRGLNRIDNNLLVHYIRATCDTSTIRDILNLNESPEITRIKEYLNTINQDDVGFEHNKQGGLGSMVVITFPSIDELLELRRKEKEGGVDAPRTGVSDDGFDILKVIGQ